MRFLLFLVAILISPYVGWSFALVSGQAGPACVIGMSTTYAVAGLISALVITTTVVRWKSIEGNTRLADIFGFSRASVDAEIPHAYLPLTTAVAASAAASAI